MYGYCLYLKFLGLLGLKEGVCSYSMLVTIISVFLFLCIELSFNKSCFLPFSCFIALIAQLDTKERLSSEDHLLYTVLVFLSYFIVIAYNY